MGNRLSFKITHPYKRISCFEGSRKVTMDTTEFEDVKHWIEYKPAYDILGVKFDKKKRKQPVYFPGNELECLKAAAATGIPKAKQNGRPANKRSMPMAMGRPGRLQL